MKRLPVPLLVFHVLFAVFMLAPLIVVVLVAFTDKGYIAMPFNGASLRWFYAILNHPEFIDAFYHSLALAAGSATISALLALPTGIAIAWNRFYGREAILGLLLSPLMVPSVVLGIALLRFLAQIGFTGTMTGLVMAHAVFILPYVLRLILSAAVGFDKSIAQAAHSLGASSWTVFSRIELPLLVPGIVGGWIIAFITSFDELTMTVFIAAPSTQTLPVMLYAYITNTIDPLLASISTVLMAMTLVLMLVIERFYGLDRLLGGQS
ncbi:MULTISPECIES: ABC transporter permease [unclassified Mesorhizobium]|uniref:ABC transporter permease n=1 Tax=unclassified Mesorhizobium TaxID=325217 RepID=UPI00112A2ACE|nr:MULTISPECIES: ABC transporter permease [unclassified Mesorhizobium]TPL02160.1 ABC transporter permease [Mesorhizobium sp. B2-4-16]TPL57400.1 ABC transporter permease [Mesorhizobium sp. B2-4-3]